MIGNYWADYHDLFPNAQKVCRLWDTPYAISGTSQRFDNYPLYYNPYIPNSDSVPIVSFTLNSTNITQEEDVMFTSLVESDNIPLQYQWNFGDGTINSTEINHIHKFTSNETFIVTLTVIDDEGDTGIHSMEIKDSESDDTTTTTDATTDSTTDTTTDTTTETNSTDTMTIPSGAINPLYFFFGGGIVVVTAAA